MAHIATSAPYSNRVLSSIVAALSAMGNTLISISGTHEKVRQIEVLSAMSDEQLDARGLRREDIPRHVFGGWMI